MKMDENSHKIAGISLPSDIYISKVDLENSPVFVHEKGSSAYHNLQQVALSVSCHRPVLLCGPVGSGKTSTVEYLSFRTGHKTPNHKNENFECLSLFLKVQLGEQTDSRMLLGGYQCTEIPGQFVWKPGILTQAVMKGHWLLLEDIDSTSSDVVTVIENLVKTQSLCIPGYCDYIVPHKHFQLFATQRIQGHGLCSNVKFNMFKQWNTIFLKPLTSSEIVNIICKKYPKLSAIASRLVSAVEVDCFENVADKGRVPSVRDILKWCSRCDEYFETGNLDSILRIYHDAIDIFCGFMNKESRFKIASQIGTRLGIVDNKANFISNKYKPNIIISENELFAGRACIKKDGKNVTLLNRFKNNVFSLNRQSCCLIEKICCCLDNTEPVLLVGETGCGKTTVLQYIADTLGKNLVVINMNQQSDTADLIGGYKPVTFKWIMKPFCDHFESLFRDLFKAEKNVECLNKFSKLVKKENWETLMNFIIHVWKTALIEIESRLKNFRNENGDEKTHLKCSETDIKKWESRYKKWKDLGKSIEKISKQKKAAEKSLVFSFVEGSLVTAIKKGDWVLLDEINLASSETLDCLSGLLENSNESISLLEKGESHPIRRNSEFRLFAAMNPATDVGKKQLPIGLRNRFTEFYIDELDEPSDLYPLVETYLGELNQTPNKLKKIVMFYLNVKNKLKNDILNGNGKKPHFSLRNLCRALSMTSRNPCGSFPRSIYESLSVSFLTQLDSKSYQIVMNLITKAVTDGDIKTILNKSIPRPNDERCLCLEGFWLHRGPLEPFTPEDYILTPTVQRHLRDLIKIVSLGNGIPILLEGDTSVGKTSLISYLAKCTGNICSRVNNHEHTDIQEYIGTYVADSGGKLVFKEGILCEAMRKGYWLILDELNLAPTEVLEALNRVLDDNRELFIPETQETIRAHNRFLLFATQNPTGIYGGRKELSRAFRNRFIELHFNQIPPNELVTILEKRCQLPISYCKKMVSVMTDLQLRRRGSDIFVGKSGFITLRDLFRWGERYRRANVTHIHYDWEQHMADEGYLLLAGRVRLRDETKVIEEVIAKYFKKKPDPENLFSLHENTSHASREILTKIIEYSDTDAEFAHIVWTYDMRRLAVLVCKALQFSEPVLIVGETGCGKTSVVQILAKIKMQQLYSVNCHMHSEGADFLGGLRPVRSGTRAEGKLFEWCDGPLIKAMVTGSLFLADEISLADDSVLERLNSLLEPERTILLAEKGGELLGNDNDDYVIVANEKFQFIGTMNPGGDYGKKELSPALRNRFTEIWADSSHHKFESFYEIIRHNLDLPLNLRDQVSNAMVDFLKWLQEKEIGKKITLSNRDIMTWVNFIKSTDLNWFESSIQGIFLTFLDGLGSGSRIICDGDSLKNFKEECLVYFTEKCSQIACKSKEELLAIANDKREFVVEENRMGFPPFYISKGECDVSQCNYVYVAPTPFSNAKKIFRALTMKKAILLEGSPGVGKTSIVTALAKVTGHKLTRINLSDQTDISDLFGADLPEEGGKAGSFVWRDGPFLTALKEGHWILLDELNLASQSVLEGLNAVLDHRGSVYIPELDKVFELSQETRVFGCQNPLKEGGNRRGLPTSFLNRFTQVYVEPLTESDYTIILEECFPELRHVLINNLPFIHVMVNFSRELRQGVAKGLIGACGGPWEFNLRDMIRWAEGTKKDLNLDKKESSDFSNLLSQNEKDRIRVIYRHMDLIYLSRMRTHNDRNWVNELFLRQFGNWDFKNERVQMYKTHEHLIVGDNVASVDNVFIHGDVEDFEMLINPKNFYGNKYEEEDETIFKLCSTHQGKMKFQMLRILEKQLPVLSNLCQCINMNWLPILVGESGSGKTSCVRVLATLTGAKLRVMSCNSAMDTTEILGGFEQADFNRHVEDISESVRAIVLSGAKYCLKKGFKGRCLHLLQKWMDYCSNTRHEDLIKIARYCILVDNLSTSSARERYQSKINTLLDLLRIEELDGGGDMRRFAEIRSQLISELKDLEENLWSDDWVNFGGKFEWVDSVLVKALKEGSWLLLEDVNLCSNAVLDRLNGLLEPNGCLILGERGAGKDGRIITLTPHPDFRLIFSMDPANGFISRAMRNRGVEIFTSLNNEISHWPKLDLISLLSDAGIKDVRVQNALIKIGNDVGNLVSNGFWTSQYLKHGFSKLEAVRMSTLQKMENISDLSKEEFLNVIADIEKLEGDERQIFEFTFLRPEIDVYIVDPKYARLKQWCGLIHMILTAAATENFSPTMSPKVFESFSPDLQHWPPDKKLPALSLAKLNLFHVYATAPGHVLADLKAFMNPIISSFSHLNATKVILDVMNLLEKITPQPHSDSVDLPWDLRWFENLYRIFATKFNKYANNHLLLLKFAIDGFNQSNIENSEKNLTVEEYSKYLEKGQAEDSFPGYPIVGNFFSFLKAFDKFTVDTLNDHELCVSDEEAKWFFGVIKWRFRLQSQGQLVLLSGANKNVVEEDTLTLLILHLSWLYKAFINDKEVGMSLQTNDPINFLRKKYKKFLMDTRKSVFPDEYSDSLIRISNEFRKCLNSKLGRHSDEPDADAWEVKEKKETIIKPDPVIIRSVLNDYVEYFNGKIPRFLDIDEEWRSNVGSNVKFLSILGLLENQVGHVGNLKNSFETLLRSKSNGKPEIVSELLYFSLRILNENYSFSEGAEETEMQVSSVLPYHRPVWTCRILEKVFDPENLWTLSNYDKFQNDFENLALTVFPNVVRWFEKKNSIRSQIFDFWLNEKQRIKYEVERVISAAKKTLNGSSLKEEIKKKLEKSRSLAERNFFSRLNETTALLLSLLSLERDDGTELDSGCLWLILGSLEFFFLREGKIDPIRKKLIKSVYAQNEVDEGEMELMALKLHSSVTGISLDHFYVKKINDQLRESREKLEKYQYLKRIERDPTSFRIILAQIDSFQTVSEEIVSFCHSVVQRRFPENSTRNYCRKGRYFLLKIRSLCQELEKFVLNFRDLIYPILAALSQIEHGLNLILSELIRLQFSKEEQFESYVTELATFPVPIGTDVYTKFNSLSRKAWSSEALKRLQENKVFALFGSYLASYNEWRYFRKDKQLLQLLKMFSAVVEYWKIEEERLKQKEIEKESLYLKRGTEQCKVLTEEEELLNETLNLFPTFENDFSDGNCKSVVKNVCGSLNENHFLQISHFHMNIMTESAIVEWNPTRPSSAPKPPDHVTPICMRFTLLFEILPYASFLLTRKTDEKLLPGLLVLMQARKSGFFNSDVKILGKSDGDYGYDFYRDENLPEARKCLEILEDLKRRVIYFLEEWPEHPGLLEMKRIIEKILSFPITSPIMRFLTGLELLLKCGQDWERVAIEEVSILDHIQKLTGLIIEWRKLELKGWKTCLEAAHRRLKEKAVKWWFHFWCLVEEYLGKNKLEEEIFFDELLKTLSNFLETSPVCEFDVRLEIILSYHHHLLHEPASKKRDNLCIALWNLHAFYQQFKSEVFKKLKTDSSPIFTKLNQFVKIAKWHDITYWSLKEAINKSHRTLIKFVKEYEVLLKQKVDLKSIELTSNGKKDESKLLMESTKPFVDKTSRQKQLNITDKKLFTLIKLREKFKRARKYSEEIIKTDRYSNLIFDLDDLAIKICENVDYYGKLDVNRELSIEKQRSQAKNIVQQKKRALTDLFKMLSFIGVSYRAGSTEAPFGVVEMCKSPPLSHLDDGSFSSDGENYYLKNISRRFQLLNFLLTPSKEIGPQIIERLKGFSGHLMEVNRKLRISLSDSSMQINRLGNFEKMLNSVVGAEEEEFFIVSQKRFGDRVVLLVEFLQKACYRLDEFECLLDSWPEPERHDMKLFSYLGGDETPEIFTASKSDHLYRETRQRFNEISKKFSFLKSEVERNFSPKPIYRNRIRNGKNKIFKDGFVFFTSKDVTFFNKCIDECRTVLGTLKDFSNIFNNDCVECDLTRGLSEVLESFGNLPLKYSAMDTITEEERVNLKKNLIDLVERLIKNILLGVERVVKAAPTEPNFSQGSSFIEPFSEVDGPLMNRHLTEKLIDSIENDLSHLNLATVNKIQLKLFRQLSGYETSDIIYAATDIHGILNVASSFVHIFFTLCEYFVSRQSLCYRTSGKLTSIIHKVFIMVAQKGYCAPPEYEEEGEDGEGKGETKKEKEGGGFTGNDGLGGEDVSGRIESEDQLEDARAGGSEKEEEGREECEENENGIEMSENFDGKTQSIDKKENDEETDEGETEPENELDLEMGETENDADKLDSRMWSDSSDEEDINKNDKGGGEKIDEDEYAAKGEEEEGNSDGENSSKDRKKRQKKKDLNDMEDVDDNGDQVDPYHGHNEPEPEPEPLNLPDDMQLDDGEAKDDENGEKENPFDIDSMKKHQFPMETDENEVDQEEKLDREEDKEFDGGSQSGESETMQIDEMESNEGEGETQEEEENEQKEREPDKYNEEVKCDDGAIDEKEREKKEEETMMNSEDASVSNEKPSEMPVQAAPETKASSDQVGESTENETKDFDAQETFHDSEVEPKGVGQAEAQGNQRGHEARTSKKEKFKSGEPQARKERKRERPGKSADDRCLGDEQSTFNKRLKTIDEPEKKRYEVESEDQRDLDQSDIYQHVSEKIDNAVQLLDAATKEQSRDQSMPLADDEDAPEEPENDNIDQDILMDVDEESDLELKQTSVMKPSEFEKIKNENKNSENETGEGKAEDVKQEMVGEVIETMMVERGPETSFFSKLSEFNDGEMCFLEPDQIKSLREEIQRQLLLQNNQGFVTGESTQTWQLLVSVVDGLARDLSEQLRPILEPSRATRLKGDYRTGRRINMRKVISYVASEFRKDNIWLRRTKPWKRDHEIVVALDDSHSMFHNESRELAFESLALVFRALELIEAGRLGVLSFGEKTKIVHSLNETFSIYAGARIIQEFSFEQKKTLLCEMLNLSVSMMTKEKRNDNVAQLLLIISDGRGVFSEGLEEVKKAVRRAVDSGIFIVFIIIDNPKSKDSIMDIRMPEFRDGKFVEMKSYMEHFPFPFYLVVRDIATLPNTLSDALRQWFQLIHCTNSDS